jgi:hypothetical protein
VSEVLSVVRKPCPECGSKDTCSYGKIKRVRVKGGMSIINSVIFVCKKCGWRW